MNTKQRETLDKAIEYTNNMRACSRIYEPVKIKTADMYGDCHVQLIYDGIASALFDTCYSFVIGKRGGMYRFGKGAKREYLTLADFDKKAKIF